MWNFYMVIMDVILNNKGILDEFLA